LGNAIEVPIGTKFGRLTVVSEPWSVKDANGRAHRFVMASCECDSEPQSYSFMNLRSGHTKSCGCLIREATPIGTRFGRLTVTSEPWIVIAGGRHRRRVMASCECDSEPRSYMLSDLRGGNSTSCGCILREKLGFDVTKRPDDYPRLPTRFRKKLASKTCAWVLCGSGFAKDERLNTDHDHHCSRHESHLACIYCVRGHVHTVCNSQIAYWEWAYYQGLGPIPDNVVGYLLKSRPLTLPGEAL
jgi:hypothetical protein